MWRALLICTPIHQANAYIPVTKLGARSLLLSQAKQLPAVIQEKQQRLQALQKQWYAYHMDSLVQIQRNQQVLDNIVRLVVDAVGAKRHEMQEHASVHARYLDHLASSSLLKLQYTTMSGLRGIERVNPPPCRRSTPTPS
jgi:response regulator RpfG family c-di-GMP phosphodiesterase